MSESAVPNAPSPSPALDDTEALPAGTRLAEFEIRNVLGRGGFGIVYLAMDLTLQRQVAIKEYLPAALAGRRANGRLAVHCAGFAEAFEVGLRSFVNESRLLARFDHPALVKVHRFWEANNTAYMVMPYYQGVTLTQVRQSMNEPPSQAWLRRILSALLGALEVMHRAKVVHRDVAPDNIMLLPSGSPVLLDFGAARHVLEDQAQTITALVKPAYAPIEQYAVGSHFGHGAWTDIYGVAATLHYCLIGRPPPTAAARIIDDEYEPLGLSRALLEPASGEPYDRAWLGAIDWGLAVKPQDRPQSIALWQCELEQHAIAPAPRPTRGRTHLFMSSAAAVAALTTQATTARPLLTARSPVDAFTPTQADRPAAALPSLRERVTAAANALAATQALTAGAALRAKALWSSRAWPAITACTAASLASIDERASAAAQSCSGAWARTKALAAQRAQACMKAMATMRAPSFANTQSGLRAWPWLTASVMLGVLAGLGWRALTPPVPALSPATSMTPAAPAVDIARRSPFSPPAAALMPAVVTLPPRPMPAVHAPSVVDDDEIDKPGAAVAPGESAPPGKRKPKAHRPKSPTSVDAVATRVGPQVVEAHREPSWTRIGAPTPRDQCAHRSFFGALTCMSQTCANPKWSQHAQCRNWHAMERRYMADSRP